MIIGFDLDMTLVDSSAGITHCMDYILTKYGITSISKQEMYNTIGVPLRDAFLKWIPDEERCDKIVAEYRAIFNEIALPKIVLLKGALDTLKAVKRIGARVLVVSSRGQQSLEDVIKFAGIEEYVIVRGLIFMFRAMAITLYCCRHIPYLVVH
tara:strand:- start:30 stop:488 length:459 start_codon:yes stop_codon:yes gene_type:complete